MSTDIFIKNLDVVFFIYGFAFVVLGIILFLQLRITKKSRFRLLYILWLLAWFGVIHGTNEFIDLFILIKGDSSFLKIFGASVLFISYLFIFLFGYQLINIGKTKRLGIWFPFIITLLFFGFPVLSGVTSYNTWNISSRYFLGFPGAILSAIGFFLYYQSEADRLRKAIVKRYFICAALFFGLYGILGGLIVPEADFFPASVINNASFISWSGIPVQIFRAISAVGIAWSLWHIVNIFNIEDAAERKRAEEMLQQSEEKYRTLIDNIQDGVFIIQDAEIQFVNEAFARMAGYAVEEVIGKHFRELVAPEYMGMVADRYYRRQAGEDIPREYEFRILHRDGKARIIVNMNVGLISYRGRVASMGTVKDITERKNMEEKIKDQAALLDKAQDAIIVWDLEHRIIYWNKSAVRLYGWTEEEAIGKNANELLYKEEPHILIEARKRVIEGGEWIGELEQVTKNGKKIIVESRWTLVHDSDGRPKSILIVNTDITEKKKIEAQFFRAQRMESIGTLASGIAHDLNNVLVPIMLTSQILREKFTDEQSQRLFNIIETNTQRGADLIKQVLSFARGVEGEHMTLQVTHLIYEIKKIAKETFPRSIETRTDVAKDLWTISGDATQLHQILMNLCVNARDAMPDGGVLSISAENLFMDENYARMNIEARVGNYIVITVSDNGDGISPGVMDRIFEPFFTTKEPGKGTGLGLSTVHAIVKGHGGFVNVYSEVGKGTTFKVYLPAITITEELKVQVQRYESSIGQGELVFVVDDEVRICESTRRVLETHGYKAITANDGAEAVALYVQYREVIEIVLVDMMMPVMDGHACIRALRKINPDVRIIAVSGLTGNGGIIKAAGTTVHAFLSKPYTAEKLLKTIREVLSK
ncbi:PAS domain S-box [Candidatus Methanoperedens nitroreducens]|uniref:PAS domain S-box n=1 Tax=Candidatus Methanoperedens nitratireducens TaxID=1392998 RepID=A0A062V602_9EURY|nr:PAS domain S-box protein [Candidatus Methanoperedens nitroreducens]KCZ71993.1 PAS domain S-box [Candidatus Methanoperedens nitroreducens]MDJ1422031.1 PAS domain S-box protein [Candidatus Methanoperedens sp.]